MIITRTPFRISFAGGGTDICDYYKTGYGAVVSTTINKYIYITVNKRFDDSIRVSYAQTEIVDDVNSIKHDIVRECLKMVEIEKGIEITSIADIPAGTGLGSSSSFTVGLLNALYTYIGQQRSAHELAVKACQLEIHRLGNPIGKQDQFAAAYGGLNYYQFNGDESVSYVPLPLDERQLRRLNQRLLMFYTGITRSASEILDKQRRHSPSSMEKLEFLRDQAVSLRSHIQTSGNLDQLGALLHEGWLKKRSLTEGISSGAIDSYYKKALKAGAEGGKILGAGGGGFLLIYCREERQQAVREALPLRELDFLLTNHGSRVVYIGE